MKIGTDGTLLGAWATVEGAKHILDIGTGTGVIALMTAQRNAKAKVTAIEINEGALVDADFNIKNSPWADRVMLVDSSLQEFKPKESYDVIVSNPPFFENSLKAETNDRNNARHTDSLHYSEILAFAQEYLSKNGTLALILPVENAERCIEKSAEYNLFLKRKTKIKPVPHKPPHRIAFELTNLAPNLVEENELTIETGKRHDYTEDYIALTNAFYIIM